MTVSETPKFTTFDFTQKILPHRKNSDQCFQARQKRAIVTEKFHHFTANLSKTWQLSLNSWVQI